jgi:hypothetical protein
MILRSAFVTTGERDFCKFPYPGEMHLEVLELRPPGFTGAGRSDKCGRSLCLLNAIAILKREPFGSVSSYFGNPEFELATLL